MPDINVPVRWQIAADEKAWARCHVGTVMMTLMSTLCSRRVHAAASVNGGWYCSVGHVSPIGRTRTAPDLMRN